MFSFRNKKVIGVGSSEVHCSKSMEKSQVIQKKLYVNIRFYIFTSENTYKIYTIYQQYFPEFHYFVHDKLCNDLVRYSCIYRVSLR